MEFTDTAIFPACECSRYWTKGLGQKSDTRWFVRDWNASPKTMQHRSLQPIGMIESYFLISVGSAQMA